MANSNRILQAVALLLRIALGFVFIYAAYSKLKYPWQVFAMGIDSYNLLPERGVEFVARTLPPFELLLGVLLIVGRFARTSTVITTGLLLMFFGLLVRAYAKGMEINCGCFGPGETLTWKTLLRDGAMLAGSVFVTVIAFRSRRKAV